MSTATVWRRSRTRPTEEKDDDERLTDMLTIDAMNAIKE